MKALIVFATTDGHTAKVTTRLADGLGRRGVAAEVVRCNEATAEPRLEDYDLVVVGGSVHGGRVQPELQRFIAQRRAELERVPSALFVVSMSAKAGGQGETRVPVDRLVQATAWSPGQVALIAGCLAYTRYGWFRRFAMKRIARRAGLPTDTSRDHEFTDWAQVDAFAGDLAATIAPRRRRAGSSGAR